MASPPRYYLLQSGSCSHQEAIRVDRCSRHTVPVEGGVERWRPSCKDMELALVFSGPRSPVLFCPCCGCDGDSSSVPYKEKRVTAVPTMAALYRPVLRASSSGFAILPHRGFGERMLKDLLFLCFCLGVGQEEDRHCHILFGTVRKWWSAFSTE